MTALDLPGTLTGRNHPQTSRAAADRVVGRSGTQRRRVFEALAYRAMTDPELQAHLGLGANSERPRRVELRDLDLIQPLGERVVHGERHTVWTLSPQGWALILEGDL